MSDQPASWAAKFGAGVVLALIVVNLFSGLVAKKVGIPGVFEIEFGPAQHMDESDGNAVQRLH